MNYVKPNPSRFGRVSVRCFDAGDGLSGVLSAIGAIIFTIVGFIAGLENDPEWFLLCVSGITFAVMLRSYYRNSVNLAEKDGDSFVNRAQKILTDLNGCKYEKSLAIPMYEKIFWHAARNDGRGHGTYGANLCDLCEERLMLMSKLVPSRKSIDDKSDMEAVHNYLHARRELGLE